MKFRLHIFALLLASVVSAMALPEVNVFVNAANVTEALPIQFTLHKDGAGTAVVPFAFDGTAVEGTNFQLGSEAQTLVIPDGVNDLRLNVYTLRDQSTNTDVTLFFKLLPDPSYQIGPAGGAGVRIIEYYPQGIPNYPPGVFIPSVTRWSDRVDFQVRVQDADGIAALWVLADNNIIGQWTNLPSFVLTNFSWLNPPVGRHEVSAVAMDNKGLAAGLSNQPPVVVIVGDQFTYPKVGGSSTNGVSLTSGFQTSGDDEGRHRRLLLEFPIPADATNGEGYLEFKSYLPTFGVAHTNEIFAYAGDGLLSTNDLYVSGEQVTRFGSGLGTNDYKIDITPFIRMYAGGFLGLWINDLPGSSALGLPATRFSDFKLEILPDSIDEPTTVRWLNPLTATNIPFFEPVEFRFEVSDIDSRVTAVEVDSAEAGPLARFEGTLSLGTNVVSMTWTNPIPGHHTLSVRTFNEDNISATNQLGSVTVDALPAKVEISPDAVPTRPLQNPYPINALVTAVQPVGVQAELLLAGTLLDSKHFDLVVGTNIITLLWTNPIAGDGAFQIRLTDAAGNSAASAARINVAGIEHKWLDTTENAASIAVVDAAGRVRTWGYNYGGDLGLGFVPQQLPYGNVAPASVLPPPGLKWRQVASGAASISGAQFRFALADDGSLWGWGYNWGGILGYPVADIFRSPTPIPVPAPTGVSWFRKIDCARNAFGAIDQNRDLWYSGATRDRKKLAGPWLDVRAYENSLLLLSTNGVFTRFINGVKDNFPLPGNVKGTEYYSACGDHFLAIGDDGQLYAWGNNDLGQLPLANSTYVSTFTQAAPVPGVKFWTQVTTSTNLSLAVDDSGRLFSWGSSPTTGARNPARNQPALVDVPETGWLDIAVSPSYALALSEKGNLYVWGTIFANTPTRKRTIQFPELMQGLPNLLDPNFTANLATFDLTTLSATNGFAINFIAPTNAPMEIQYSTDLQTWLTLTNVTTISNAVQFSRPIELSTNAFFRIR